MDNQADNSGWNKRRVFESIGVYIISFVMISFAIIKFTGTQFQLSNHILYVPLNRLDKFWHAWSFFGRSYLYNVFIGVGELTVGLTILFTRTRLLGLLLAFVIYLNVIVIDFAFEVGALWHAILEFIIILLLLQYYLGDLKKFFWDMGGKFKNIGTPGSTISTLYAPLCFIF